MFCSYVFVLSIKKGVLACKNVAGVFSLTVVTSSLCFELAIFMTDGHHCFMSGNIAKTEGGQIHLNFIMVM